MNYQKVNSPNNLLSNFLQFNKYFFIHNILINLYHQNIYLKTKTIIMKLRRMIFLCGLHMCSFLHKLSLIRLPKDTMFLENSKILGLAINNKYVGRNLPTFNKLFLAKSLIITNFLIVISLS